MLSLVPQLASGIHQRESLRQPHSQELWWQHSPATVVYMFYVESIIMANFVTDRSATRQQPAWIWSIGRPMLPAGKQQTYTCINAGSSGDNKNGAQARPNWFDSRHQRHSWRSVLPEGWDQIIKWEAAESCWQWWKKIHRWTTSSGHPHWQWSL